MKLLSVLVHLTTIETTFQIFDHGAALCPDFFQDLAAFVKENALSTRSKRVKQGPSCTKTPF